MTHPYLSLEHPIRLAHRGSSTRWPENTDLAFRNVVEIGYRYIEIDVRVTADGVAVVFHDATLDRVTDGSGRVDRRRWDELRRLDAAWSFAPERGHPHRGTGVGIPRLDEVLVAYPDTRFNIDLKQPGAEWPVAEVVAATDRWDSVLVTSFSDRRVTRFRRITGGRVATGAGSGATLAMWAASRVGRARRATPVAYQVPIRDRAPRFERRFVDAVHTTGAHVHVWTVNDPGEMRRLLAMGVDGIVTDRPEILDRVVAGGGGSSR